MKCLDHITFNELPVYNTTPLSHTYTHHYRYILDKDSDTKGTVCLQKQWSNVVEPFAFQSMVHDLAAHCPLDRTLINTLEELFLPESTCFLLTPPHYGSMAQVIIHWYKKGSVCLFVCMCVCVCVCVLSSGI